MERGWKQNWQKKKGRKAQKTLPLRPLAVGLRRRKLGIPNPGVACSNHAGRALSAVQFHELTTQAPFEIWMAIEGKAWHPRSDWPVMRFVRFSGAALTEGIEEHCIEGVTVKVYTPAKTVADRFKYRNKIGLDVALEALRDCRQQRKCSNDDLWRYAEICRVANVMKP